MPLTLILMRHAKSSWTDPMMDDFDRPLNPRGQASAPAIANWLVTKGHLPETAVVSSARRTVETWELMAPAMPETATMESSSVLYLASPDIILSVLKAQTATKVAIICHNPGIAEFAQRIVQVPAPHPEFGRFPTAATAVIQFDIESWSAADWFTGSCVDFVVPRDLV